MVDRIDIYTDGSCIKNPGPGGYGVVLLHGQRRKELSGGFRFTTNNRMEILAAIKGLEELKKSSEVTLFSDSQYLVRAIEEGWAVRWKANGWKRNKKGEKALNPDLWDRMLAVCGRHEVVFKWVRGHSGVPENERCDHLANQAAHGSDLDPDQVYEASL